MHYAVYHKNQQLIQLLIEKWEAKLDVKNKVRSKGSYKGGVQKGITPVQLAEKYELKDIVQMLQNKAVKA